MKAANSGPISGRTQIAGGRPANNRAAAQTVSPPPEACGATREGIGMKYA